jgi:lysozyme
MNKERLEKQLKRHEDYRKHPYKDTEGNLTVAFGRNLDGKGISRSEARMLLSNDIDDSLAECKKRFSFWDNLSELRQEVVCNMMFNLGWPKLKGFKKMIAALEKKDYELAAAEMLDSKWRLQVKGRALELARQMRTNETVNPETGKPWIE